MANPTARVAVAATGGVLAAIGSALCCAGPLVAVAIGMSGAGFAATFEPLRPYFVAGTVVALTWGFALIRREEQRACVPGSMCASPVARRRMKIALWTATATALPMLTFPWWSAVIF